MTILAAQFGKLRCFDEMKKIISHIAFLLSLLVIMGHDIVPHLHEAEEGIAVHSVPLPPSSNNDLSNLRNVFSLFQHSTAETHLVFFVVAEKKADFQSKTVYQIPYLSAIEYRLAWYANYKKQRFWEYVTIPQSNSVHSFSLRGPPIS